MGIDKSHINNTKQLGGITMTEELKDFMRYCELLEKIYGNFTPSSKEDNQELDRLSYKLGLHGVPEIHSSMNFNRLEKELEKEIMQ